MKITGRHSVWFVSDGTAYYASLNGQMISNHEVANSGEMCSCAIRRYGTLFDLEDEKGQFKALFCNVCKLQVKVNDDTKINLMKGTGKH